MDTARGWWGPVRPIVLFVGYAAWALVLLWYGLVEARLSEIVLPAIGVFPVSPWAAWLDAAVAWAAGLVALAAAFGHGRPAFEDGGWRRWLAIRAVVLGGYAALVAGLIELASR